MRHHPQHSSQLRDSLASALDDDACRVPADTAVGARFPESPCENTWNIRGPTDAILESALYSLHSILPALVYLQQHRTVNELISISFGPDRL